MDKVSATAYRQSESLPLNGRSVGKEDTRKRKRSLFVGKFRLFNHFVHGQFVLLATFEFVTLACLMLGISDWKLEGLGDYARMLFPPTLLSFFLAAVGLYDTRQRPHSSYVIKRILSALVLSTLCLVSVNIVWVWFRGYPLFELGVTEAASSALVLFSIRGLFYRYVDGKVLRKRVMVYGAGKRAAYIQLMRRKADMRGFELVGFVSESGVSVDDAIQNSCKDILHDSSELAAWAKAHQVDEIVVALDDRRQGKRINELLQCKLSGIEVIDMLDFFERERGVIHLDLFNPGWMIYSRGFKPDTWRSFKKRAIDVLASLFLLFIFSPFIVLTIIAILIECRGKDKIFYTQKRVGRDGKPFDVYKFRSMRSDAEAGGKAQWAQKNDARVTKVGEIIRKFRIDELPQLWNVLIGDMSLVGPRPERPQFVDHLEGLNSLYPERHRVSPGVTGWAQLCYPYGASDEDSLKKLEFDLYYVKNHSFFLDMYILIQTVEVVLFQKGSR
jgi:sugar transferase (PEP-CTERM system associated)